LAYGPQGNPPKIQPNENLIFELEVLDISDKAPAPQQLPMQQPKDNKKQN
jgi:FKBP-type peptidyl-prolyl cis-trans isomerase FkpA